MDLIHETQAGFRREREGEVVTHTHAQARVPVRTISTIDHSCTLLALALMPVPHLIQTITWIISIVVDSQKRRSEKGPTEVETRSVCLP